RRPTAGPPGPAHPAGPGRGERPLRDRPPRARRLGVTIPRAKPDGRGASMQLYTIGFTQRPADDFFGALRRAGVKRLVDIRLNNTSQLAGFTKREHLPYFLRELCGAEYVHEPLLAPSQDLFVFRRKQHGAWDEYERAYRGLLAEREVERRLNPEL